MKNPDMVQVRLSELNLAPHRAEEKPCAICDTPTEWRTDALLAGRIFRLIPVCFACWWRAG